MPYGSAFQENGENSDNCRQAIVAV